MSKEYSETMSAVEWARQRNTAEFDAPFFDDFRRRFVEAVGKYFQKHNSLPTAVVVSPRLFRQIMLAAEKDVTDEKAAVLHITGIPCVTGEPTNGLFALEGRSDDEHQSIRERP